MIDNRDAVLVSLTDEELVWRGYRLVEQVADVDLRDELFFHLSELTERALPAAELAKLRREAAESDVDESELEQWLADVRERVAARLILSAFDHEDR